MKHCKRILATLLSMAMLFTMAATPVYAAPESTGDSIYKDVSSSEGYYPGLVIQNKLGIFVGDDNGNFNPEATITRAEAAAVVVRMKGLTNAISSSQSTNFSDVPSSHWASGYIATANSMGIVEGYGNGLFGPEDPVKYEEILTMIIRAMGYDPMVNSRGSAWPGNYVSVASSIGVKSTEGGSVGREAPRKVVASLVYSALKAPLMEVVSWGSQTEYAIMDGKGDRDLETLLSENFDAYVIKALVDTTDKASLSSSSEAQEDCAELEILDGYDVEYFEELKDDEELLEVYDNGMLRNHLGAVITAFVREDDSNGAEYELLAFSVLDKDEDVVVINDTANIVTDGSAKSTKNFGDDNDSRPVLVYYDEDDDKESCTIDKEAKILINNVFYAGVKDADVDETVFDVDDGTVTLRDTDSDGYYDLIQIDTVLVFVVDEINEKYLKITDANNYYSAIRFDDYYNDDITYSITTTDGKSLDFEDLRQYDVLSIKANALKENGKIDTEEADYYEIVVCRDIVEGMVKTKGTDNNGKPEYGIDGEDYTIVPNIIEELQLGDEGNFHLDAKGRIAYYTVSENSNYSYGYIVKIGYDTGSFDDEILIKMVKDNGKVETFETPSKYITIYDEDGDSHRVHYGSATSSYESIDDWEDELEGALVAYKLNTADEINKIYLPEDRDDKASTFSLDKSLTNARYKESTESIGTVDVDEDTIVFFIPDDATDEDDIEVGTIAGLEDDEYYDVDAYHMTSDYVARLLVVKSEMTSVSLKDNIYLVKGTSMATMQDEDDEVSQRIEAYHNGELVKLWVDPDEEEFDVERGDAIAVKLNSSGYITNVVVLYDIDDAEIWEASRVMYEGEYVEDLKTVAGYVTYKKSKSITIATDPEDTDAESFYAKDANVYIVDGISSRSAVKLADFSDIEEYEDNEDLIVFARIYEDDITDIVIYDDVFSSVTESTPSETPEGGVTPSIPGDEEEEEEEEETPVYSYIVSIATSVFANGTAEADVIDEIEVERYANNELDEEFILDATKIALVGYDATTAGSHRLTVSYDGVNALNKISIVILDAEEEPVVSYESASSITLTVGASTADILAALYIEKYVDEVLDDTFVVDEALVDFGTLDVSVAAPETAIEMFYDGVSLGEILVTVEAAVEPTLE